MRYWVFDKRGGESKERSDGGPPSHRHRPLKLSQPDLPGEGDKVCRTASEGKQQERDRAVRVGGESGGNQEQISKAKDRKRK